MNLDKLRQVYYTMNKRTHGRSAVASDYVYKDCHNDWSSSSEFIKWAITVAESGYYKDGWQLDKDIIVRGNKTYGPETCCFIPQEINKLLIKADSIRGDFPIGVRETKSGTYRGVCCNGTGKQLSKTFKSVDEAFQWYKATKESVIKSVACKWKSEIDPRVYDALISYKVNITD